MPKERDTSYNKMANTNSSVVDQKNKTQRGGKQQTVQGIEVGMFPV